MHLKRGAFVGDVPEPPDVALVGSPPVVVPVRTKVEMLPLGEKGGVLFMFMLSLASK